MSLEVRVGFLKKGDALVHDNCAMHASSENSELNQMLRSVGIGIVAFQEHSPELIPIELVFNFMVQIFVPRFNESSTSTHRDALSLIHSLVESITPGVAFSCFKN